MFPNHTSPFIAMILSKDTPLDQILLLLLHEVQRLGMDQDSHDYKIVLAAVRNILLMTSAPDLCTPSTNNNNTQNPVETSSTDQQQMNIRSSEQQQMNIRASEQQQMNIRAAEEQQLKSEVKSEMMDTTEVPEDLPTNIIPVQLLPVMSHHPIATSSNSNSSTAGTPSPPPP